MNEWLIVVSGFQRSIHIRAFARKARLAVDRL